MGNGNVNVKLCFEKENNCLKKVYLDVPNAPSEGALAKRERFRVDIQKIYEIPRGEHHRVLIGSHQVIVTFTIVTKRITTKMICEITSSL